MLTSDRHCSVQKGENKDFLRGAVELSAAKNTSVRLYEPIIIVNIFLEKNTHHCSLCVSYARHKISNAYTISFDQLQELHQIQYSAISNE